ncbi:MAG: lactate utilization protein C, partial [Microvirga sp.]
MNARDEMLASIRRSLGVTGNEATRRLIVQDRIERAPKGTIPARGRGSAEERLAVFKTQAELALATVTEVPAYADVPQAVAEYLRNHNLPATLRMGRDPRLAGMAWADTSIEVSTGRSDGADLNAVSHAFGGVAESGTVVVISGPENPSTLNFLPDNHIVVVSAKDIAGDYEAVWSKVRFAFGKGVMP